MDDLARKLFCQLDSDFEGERQNAVELLHRHFAGHGSSFAAVVETLDAYREANEAAARRHELMAHAVRALGRRSWLHVLRSDGPDLILPVVLASLLVASLRVGLSKNGGA